VEFCCFNLKRLLKCISIYIVALKKDDPQIQQSEKAIKANAKDDQKDDGWMEVGPKNRTSHTRTVCR